MQFAAFPQSWPIAVLWLVALGGGPLRAAQSEPTPPPFSPVEWLPSVAPVLAKASVATGGIAAGTARHQIGDTVTILAQASEGGRVRQWAVVLALSATKPEEKVLRSPAFTLYLSNGSEVDFSPSPYEGMSIHVMGPFSNSHGSKRAKDVWSGSLINPDFLELGLQGTARLFRRLEDQVRSDPRLAGQKIDLNIRPSPFTAENIAETRVALAGFFITAEEERSFAGFIPAMFDFFRIASQTPGVREIIFEAMDVPWWSIIAKGGRVPHIGIQLTGPFEQVSAAEWGVPEQMEVYSLGLLLSLQGKPALVCRVAVTAPVPPLVNTAGILGIAAKRPDEKGPTVAFRVMAGKTSSKQPLAGVSVHEISPANAPDR